MSLDFDIFVAGIFLIPLFPLLSYLRFRRKRDLGFLICVGVFYLYVLGLVKFAIFPLPADPGFIRQMTQGARWSELNLIPFHFGGRLQNTLGEQLPGALKNVLMAVPFGFALPFILKARTRTYLVLCLGLGILVEGIQLALSLVYGFTYRTVDINDVIFNAVGACLGLVIFLLMRRSYSSLAGSQLPSFGPWKHAHAVLSKGEPVEAQGRAGERLTTSTSGNN